MLAQPGVDDSSGSTSASLQPLAVVDMEANFLLNKAYRYTSITSVTLLDCASIPGDNASPWSTVTKPDALGVETVVDGQCMAMQASCC